MDDYNLVIASIVILALVLFILFTVCRYIQAWTWIRNWFLSSHEEKVNLTRSEGVYNANGYLITGESTNDINLCHSGSFKRFEPVDNEYGFEMYDFTSEPTYLQPPEQTHDYPQDIYLPFGNNQMADDLYDDEEPSCSTSTNSNQPAEFTSKFISSSPTNRQPSTALKKYPPQPLRLAPSPSEYLLNALEKHETELPEKVKIPPKRPPPPVFGKIIPPPIPPRLCPPSLPPRPSLPFLPSYWLEREHNLEHIEGLRRGVSFDSLSSDTSVALVDLDGPHVTGYLCVGIVYTRETSQLAVAILEGKNLSGLSYDGKTLMDTFVRVYLLPDRISSIQTKISRKSNSPSYKSRFLFPLAPKDFHRRTLSFYVYSAEMTECTLIGEGVIRLADVSSRQSVTTWVTLTDTGQYRAQFGEILLTLTYIPTAEKLIVVVAKAINLVFPNGRKTGNPFVKVYLLRDGKKVDNKRTTTKQKDNNPVYNEAMYFHIPPGTMQNVNLRVSIVEDIGKGELLPLGHVIMGIGASGKWYSHWIQMLMAPRQPISMWHSLAK